MNNIQRDLETARTFAHKALVTLNTSTPRDIDADVVQAAIEATENALTHINDAIGQVNAKLRTFRFIDTTPDGVTVYQETHDNLDDAEAEVNATYPGRRHVVMFSTSTQRVIKHEQDGIFYASTVIEELSDNADSNDD